MNIRRENYQKGWKRTQIFLLFSWPKLREKFLEVCDERTNLEFSKYLNTLSKILRKSFPQEREVKKYVPPGFGVKTRYMEILKEIRKIPENKTSKEVFIRITTGPKYREYRKKSEKLLEHLDVLCDFLSKINKSGEKYSEDYLIERFVYNR